MPSQQLHQRTRRNLYHATWLISDVLDYLHRGQGTRSHYRLSLINVNLRVTRMSTWAILAA